MRAFTVRQPYAYAIVAGLKGYETHPRRTNIRGRVAVHAGLRDITGNEVKICEMYIPQGTILAMGAVVGTVEIVNCVPVEDVTNSLTAQEKALGDYSPGRWAWVLKNPVMFRMPVYACGKQGWWEWDEDLPEWADEDGCPMDNPNEEMKDCSGCRWFKETEGQG